MDRIDGVARYWERRGRGAEVFVEVRMRWLVRGKRLTKPSRTGGSFQDIYNI